MNEYGDTKERGAVYVAGEPPGYGYNLSGNVDKVNYLGGATFVTNENASGDEWGVTLGNFININNNGEVTGDFKDYVISTPLYMHEYGHTIDSRIFGPAYLFAIGIPSIISAKKQDGNHYEFWTEKRANRHAAKYFKKYGVDWDNDTFWYAPWEMYRKIKDKYPTD